MKKQIQIMVVFSKDKFTDIKKLPDDTKHITFWIDDVEEIVDKYAQISKPFKLLGEEIIRKAVMDTYPEIREKRKKDMRDEIEKLKNK